MASAAIQHRLGILILVMVFATSACAPVSGNPPSAQSNGLPALKQDCSLCHTGGAPNAGNLSKSEPELCLDCHPDAGGKRDHRIGVRPANPPKALPLKNGLITCSTCHDMHRNLNKRLLRMQQDAICIACHPY